MEFIKQLFNSTARFIKYSPKTTIGLIIAIPFLFNLIFGNYGIITRIGLELEKHSLTEEIKGEVDKQNSLIMAIDQLKTNDALIQQIARTRYGMVKPGETIYRIIDLEK